MPRKKNDKVQTEAVNEVNKKIISDDEIKQKFFDYYKDTLWKQYSKGLAYGSQIYAQMIIEKIKNNEFKALEDVFKFCEVTTVIPTEELEKVYSETGVTTKEE